MSETLRFATNVPREVRLKFAKGKEVESEYSGQQVMFTLNEPADSRMYLPPIAAERIYDLEIQPGELIAVCKAEVQNGRRKGIEWQIKRVDPSQEQPAAQPAPPPSTVNGTEA